MFLRLKSGTSFPQGNTIVSHLTPVAVDWGYRVFSSMTLGAEFNYGSGNHAFTVDDFNANPVTLNTFNLSESQYLMLGTVDYVRQVGSALISIGLKVGYMYASAESDLSAGLSSASVPPSTSERHFAIGTAINIDVPMKDALFLNVGGDDIFAIQNNQLSFGSLYVGLGYNL